MAGSRARATGRPRAASRFSIGARAERSRRSELDQGFGATPPRTRLDQWEQRSVRLSLWRSRCDAHIDAGFVTNLARPEGNITGISNFEFSVGGKWLQLLKECAPSVDRIAVVFDP